MNKFRKVLLVPGSLALIAAIGVACGDDDDDTIDTGATSTSPAMTETMTPDTGNGTTPDTDNGDNGDVDDDIVARFNEISTEVQSASAETQSQIQDLWDEAQEKFAELATATEDERDEIVSELEDLMNQVEEQLEGDS